MRLAITCALLAIVAFTPAEARAWNSVGHMAIVRIAYERLEDGHKTTLFELLKSHPHFKEFLAADRPAEVSEVEWVLMRASVWPDWIRPREKDGRVSGPTRYHRGEEHYINIPFVDPRDEAAFANKGLVQSDVTNIQCSLKQRCNDLQTKHAAAEDKAIAICWIFHLVGDIHQPLHNVSYFSKKYPRGDQGGNKFGIKVDGKKWKLHAYWDDLLGEDPHYLDDSGQRQAKIFKEAVAVAEHLRGLELSEAEQTKLTKNRTFTSWSREGFELAKSVAYRKADDSGLLEGVLVQLDGSMPDNAPEVGKEYAQKAHAVADIRVVLAGRRLAERVRTLLKK